MSPQTASQTRQQLLPRLISPIQMQQDLSSLQELVRYPHIYLKIHFFHWSSLKLPNFIFWHFNLPNPTIDFEIKICWSLCIDNDQYTINVKIHFTLNRARSHASKFSNTFCCTSHEGEVYFQKQNITWASSKTSRWSKSKSKSEVKWNIAIAYRGEWTIASTSGPIQLPCMHALPL